MHLARLATLAAATLLSFASPSLAAGDPPKIDAVRGYLIWEDSGKMSKNVADTNDQIVANSENGSSIQMIMDIIMKTNGEAMYEGEQPFLYVTVHSLGYQVGDPPMLDTGFPISYIGRGGQLVRSIIVEHNCSGISLQARVMVGDKVIDEFNKDYSITCGD